VSPSEHLIPAFVSIISIGGCMTQTFVFVVMPQPAKCTMEKERA